jgi:hypothetical protein
MSTEVLRPYRDLAGVFDELKYRSSPGSIYEDLNVQDSTQVMHTVRVDDLRSFPTHEFSIRFNDELIKKTYGKDRENIRLVILLRDRALHRDHALASHQIDEVPEAIKLPKQQLQLSSARDEMELTFVVLMEKVTRSVPGNPFQPASRLAELNVILRNSADGAQFPFRRKNADDFKTIGLPGTTSIHLHVDAPIELLKSGSGKIQDLVEVWLHETVYDAVHNDRQRATSGIRNTLITTTVAGLLFSSVERDIVSGATIEPGSVVGQLVTFIERKCSRPDGQLRERFEAAPSAATIMPWVQAAFRTTASLSRLQEESAE